MAKSSSTMRTIVRKTAKSLIIDRTCKKDKHTNENVLNVVLCMCVCLCHVEVNTRAAITRVGKYLLVLNCLRKADRKNVEKNKMADQKSTSGV